MTLSFNTSWQVGKDTSYSLAVTFCGHTLSLLCNSHFKVLVVQFNHLQSHCAHYHVESSLDY